MPTTSVGLNSRRMACDRRRLAGRAGDGRAQRLGQLPASRAPLAASSSGLRPRPPPAATDGPRPRRRPGRRAAAVPSTTPPAPRPARRGPPASVDSGSPAAGLRRRRDGLGIWRRPRRLIVLLEHLAGEDREPRALAPGVLRQARLLARAPRASARRSSPAPARPAAGTAPRRPPFSSTTPCVPMHDLLRTGDRPAAARARSPRAPASAAPPARTGSKRGSCSAASSAACTAPSTSGNVGSTWPMQPRSLPWRSHLGRVGSVEGDEDALQPVADRGPAGPARPARAAGRPCRAAACRGPRGPAHSERRPRRRAPACPAARCRAAEARARARLRRRASRTVRHARRSRPSCRPAPPGRSSEDA